MAELASLRPIFKGEEAKLDSKKNVPFQRDQIIKIFEIMGTPDGLYSLLSNFDGADFLFKEREWPGVKDMPDYHHVKRLDQ